MKALQVRHATGPLELVQREAPQPGPGQVRVKVAACGICHGDALVKEGHWPGLSYPKTPGHEIAGTIDEIGSSVEGWNKGERVGVGWAGGHCGRCVPCRRGDFVNCAHLQIPGISYDGGYADYVVVPVEALARIPAELSFEEAAPIVCAGLTTYNALRHSGAVAGDVVAVQGIGGLGHLGVQFASKMGFQTVAISKGRDKEPLAKKLGAQIYLDTEKVDPAAELMKLGGARVILATAPSGKSIAQLVNGLGHNGEVVVVGAGPDPIEVTALQLITLNRTLRGWSSGSAIDSEETLRFCVLTGIRPMIETFPLDQGANAYERMISNKVRFRAVLTPG